MKADGLRIAGLLLGAWFGFAGVASASVVYEWQNETLVTYTNYEGETVQIGVQGRLEFDDATSSAGTITGDSRALPHVYAGDPDYYPYFGLVSMIVSSGASGPRGYGPYDCASLPALPWGDLPDCLLLGDYVFRTTFSNYFTFDLALGDNLQGALFVFGDWRHWPQAASPGTRDTWSGCACNSWSLRSTPDGWDERSNPELAELYPLKVTSEGRIPSALARQNGVQQAVMRSSTMHPLRTPRVLLL